MKELNDTNFHDMSYDHLKEIALRLVPHGCFEKLYYCQTGVKLNLGLTELRSNQDIGDMLKVGYENGNAIDMYVEHFGYDIMEMAQADRNEEQNQNSIESSDDDYNSSDCEEIENVDFQTEGDESVVIKDISTSDPFLNKLCSARIMFRGTTEHIQAEIPLVDPDENQIDAVNKVKSGVHYPAFDPDIPWDKMQPTLGMRYETPQQLKLALANYGVANGYQLWYMKNDWREVLVYCGRNVEEGRCAGKKGNKDRVMPNKVRSGVKKKVVKKQIVKKKVVKKQTVKKTTVLDSGEGTSQSTKWTKKQIQDSKKVVCPFRLYASWMSNEHSFQIKSLISEHKCCRNYNLGALVTYRWIALQYFKEIIEDPFMSLRKMRDDIRQKFMIDVSLGQCTRAKQLALFDNEGGLIEHYGKLYQYRQALLESNPGSTCRLDVDESANGSATFRRIYICFKGVKDGWLAGCRKVIGLDGCFLKHTCRGDYNAMGRDANNQMYPIAWAVVRVENADNWGWFLHLLHDDLSLNDGNGITIISDSHKGLIDAVNDWLPEAEHRKSSCTLEQQFVQIMDQIKQLHEGAYDYLIQRNPNSWSRAFFEMDRRCAAFENGISESFNRAILIPRHKPIITMLEEIRSNMWKRTSDVPPLPPLVRTMPGRPQKARIKALGETSSSHTSRVGRTMTCTKCWQKGHNKADPIPKPTVEKKQPGRKKNVAVGHCAFRGRGRGSGGCVNEASGSGMGTNGGGTGDGGTSSRGGGTSSRGRGRGRRGGETTSSGGRRGGGRGSRGEYQLELDEEAFRECMEEQAREQAKIDDEQEREDSMEEAPFNQAYAEVFIPSIHNQPTQQSGVWVKDTTDVTFEDIGEAPAMTTSETTDVAEASVLEESPVDKGKGKESPADEASGTKK
ncbi:calcium/proton exchanger [Tanacetum coccineum]|uniref:Calcium/proton exchanger n=1 Tax=Tanacetum coccineum TaxID=301880 RepID=A0ABQ5E9L2_9ASTR